MSDSRYQYPAPDINGPLYPLEIVLCSALVLVFVYIIGVHFRATSRTGYCAPLFLLFLIEFTGGLLLGVALLIGVLIPSAVTGWYLPALIIALSVQSLGVVFVALERRHMVSRAFRTDARVSCWRHAHFMRILLFTFWLLQLSLTLAQVQPVASMLSATWIYFAFVYDLYTSFQSIRLLGLMGQVVTTLRETFGLPHAVNQTLLRTPRAGQQRRLIRIWLLLNMFPVMAMLVLLVPSSLGLTGGRGILVCIYVCLILGGWFCYGGLMFMDILVSVASTNEPNVTTGTQATTTTYNKPVSSNAP